MRRRYIFEGGENASNHGENSYYHFSMSFIPPLESQLYLDIPQNAAKFVQLQKTSTEGTDKNNSNLYKTLFRRKLISYKNKENALPSH